MSSFDWVGVVGLVSSGLGVGMAVRVVWDGLSGALLQLWAIVRSV